MAQGERSLTGTAKRRSVDIHGRDAIVDDEKMGIPRISSPVLVLVALIAGTVAARAETPAEQPNRPAARAASNGMSLEQAVKMAEQRFKARVVRAESQQNDGRTVYVLRMLNESGRVWTVRVDASNGAVL